jgi:hypothetical protein
MNRLASCAGLQKVLSSQAWRAIYVRAMVRIGRIFLIVLRNADENVRRQSRTR